MAANNKTGDISTKSIPPAAKMGIAIIFAAIGVFGSFKLITAESSTIAGGVVTGVALCGLLIIFFADVIDWFDLKNLKVQMRKVEEARKEVEEREREVARIALAMAEITNFIAAFQGRWGSERTSRLQKEWLKIRTKRLLTESGVEGADLDHASRWVSAVERLDALRRDEPPIEDEPEEEDESTSEWDRLFDQIEDEIKKG